LRAPLLLSPSALRLGVSLARPRPAALFDAFIAAPPPGASDRAATSRQRPLLLAPPASLALPRFALPSGASLVPLQWFAVTLASQFVTTCVVGVSIMTLVLLTSLIWTMAIVLCVASSAPSIAFLSKLSPLSSWPLVIGCASLGSLRCVSSWLARLGGAILVGGAGLGRALSVGPRLAGEAEQADGSVDSQLPCKEGLLMISTLVHSSAGCMPVVVHLRVSCSIRRSY